MFTLFILLLLIVLLKKKIINLLTGLQNFVLRLTLVRVKDNCSVTGCDFWKHYRYWDEH